MKLIVDIGGDDDDEYDDGESGNKDYYKQSTGALLQAL